MNTTVKKTEKKRIGRNKFSKNIDLKNKKTTSRNDSSSKKS
jgi:hypothetical protein